MVSVLNNFNIQWEVGKLYSVFLLPTEKKHYNKVRFIQCYFILFKKNYFDGLD
jgi:hypothetical protein